MGMTKQHYEAIAKVIASETDWGRASSPPYMMTHDVIESLADVFQLLEMCYDCYTHSDTSGNDCFRDKVCQCHRFNRQAWVEACGG